MLIIDRLTKSTEIKNFLVDNNLLNFDIFFEDNTKSFLKDKNVDLISFRLDSQYDDIKIRMIDESDVDFLVKIQDANHDIIVKLFDKIKELSNN